MYKEQLVLGVVPNKRSFLSMEEANRQKERFMKVVRSVKSELVRVVAIDDLCENGILYEMDKTDAVIDRMRTEQIDALFLPFCDFGEEQVVAKVAAALSVPVLAEYRSVQRTRYSVRYVCGDEGIKTARSSL